MFQQQTNRRYSNASIEYTAKLNSTEAEIITQKHLSKPDKLLLTNIQKFLSKNFPIPIPKFIKDLQCYLDVNTQCFLKTKDPELKLLQTIFNFDEFNKMQSKCLPSLIENDQNFLCCAPTASGKTVLFELAILKDMIDNQNRLGKIFYIAPIKALTHEIFTKWCLLFRNVLKILELNSDSNFLMSEELEQISQSDVILTTPEKFNIIMKKWNVYTKIIESIKLVIIDEVHLLGDVNRGRILESSISRLKLLKKNFLGTNFNTKTSEKFDEDELVPENLFQNFENCGKLRIVAASATLANYKEVAEWLEVPAKNVHYFGQEFRPVQLDKIVLGYPAKKNDFVFDLSLNYKLHQVVSKYSMRKPTLVFCSTQKGTVKTCQDILANSQPREYVYDESHLQRLTRASTMVDNQDLRMKILSGVGYHSAGQSRENRTIIEDLFKKGDLSVLCTTSTLAQGVNQPAYQVVIKGTKGYRGNKQGFDEYTQMEIGQMVGRAGRPQYENSGIAVIMTEKDQVPFYNQNDEQFHQEIESRYMANFLDDLNNEITLGTITTLDLAKNFVKNTFFWVRMKNNKFSLKTTVEGQVYKNLEDFMSRGVSISINDLFALKLIDKLDGSYVPTQQGKEVSRQCIEISQLKIFISMPAEEFQKLLGVKINPPLSCVIKLISSSEEFGKWRSKQEDRKELNEINKQVRYQIKGSATTGEKKAHILLQVGIMHLETQNWDFKKSINDALLYSARFSKCLQKLALNLGLVKEYLAFYNMTKICKRKAWEFDTAHLLTQIYGISPKQAGVLIANGIDNQFLLKQQSIANLNNFFGKTPKDTIGKTISKNLQCLPYQKIEINTTKIIDSTKFMLNISIQFIGKLCNHFYHKRYHLLIVSKTGKIIWSKYIYGEFDDKLNKDQKLLEKVEIFCYPVTIYLVNDYWVGCDMEFEILNQNHHFSLEGKSDNKADQRFVVPYNKNRNEIITEKQSDEISEFELLFDQVEKDCLEIAMNEKVVPVDDITTTAVGDRQKKKPKNKLGLFIYHFFENIKNIQISYGWRNKFLTLVNMVM